MQKHPIPVPAEHEVAFWTGGAAGELQIGWCTQCAEWRHPSFEICPNCLAEIEEHRAVSGKATVVAVTINHQRWHSELEVPFLIAIVALKEDPSIRLTTNIVNSPFDSVVVGLRVRVKF